MTVYSSSVTATPFPLDIFAKFFGLFLDRRDRIFVAACRFNSISDPLPFLELLLIFDVSLDPEQNRFLLIFKQLLSFQCTDPRKVKEKGKESMLRHSSQRQQDSP